MSNTPTPIDLNFRPSSYFWPMGLEKHLLATVKGAERRRHIRDLISKGQLDELEDWIASEGLSEESRDSVGRVHPRFMGGEYLPNLNGREVEIARITLASVLQDVISYRARRGKRRIYYRAVDEYSGEMINAPGYRTSTKPLALADLVKFIDRTHSIQETLECNFEMMYCDPVELSSFVSVTSPFYPQLGQLYEERFDAWAKVNRTKFGYDVEDEDE